MSLLMNWRFPAAGGPILLAAVCMSEPYQLCQCSVSEHHMCSLCCHKLVHRGGASVWYSRQRAQPPGRLRKPTLAGTHSLSSQMGDASAAQAIVRCDATCTLQPPAPRKCREAAAVPAPPPPQRGAAYESCDAALDYGCLAQRTMGRRAVAAAPCTLGLAG